MTIAFIAGSTANTNTGTSLSISLPTGTLNGHVSLGVLALDGGSGQTITPPTNWILLQRVNQSTDLGLAVYRRVIGASEPNPSWSWTTSGKLASLHVITYSGVDTATPEDATTPTGTTANFSNSLTMPNITTVTNNSWVVHCVGALEFNTFTINHPSGNTERVDTLMSQAGRDVGSESSDLAVATAGAVTSKTVSTTASTPVICGITVALKVSLGVPMVADVGFVPMGSTNDGTSGAEDDLYFQTGNVVTVTDAASWASQSGKVVTFSGTPATESGSVVSLPDT